MEPAPQPVWASFTEEPRVFVTGGGLERQAVPQVGSNGGLASLCVLTLLLPGAHPASWIRMLLWEPTI